MADTSQVWEQFGGRLRAYIGSRIDSPDDADDILQDVFYKIHMGIDGLDDASRVQAWVYSVTRNTIADYYRKRAESNGLPVPAIDSVPPDLPPDVDIDSILACLRPVVDRLPDKYRDALVMTEFEGHTQQELADREDISLSGAKSRVQRARAMIKDIMLACCHFEFDRRGNILDIEQRPGGCLYCNPS